VDNSEIVRFAQLFNDELTLDNLDRVHLVNLCRFVGIQPFGTDAFLVQRLRLHLNDIKVPPQQPSPLFSISTTLKSVSSPTLPHFPLSQWGEKCQLVRIFPVFSPS
jgi:LETM1-like protein